MTDPVAVPTGATESADAAAAPHAQALRGRFTPVQRATAGSVVTGLVSQMNLVVSGVLGARLLGPEHRGHLALLLLMPIVLSYVGTLGLPLATTYFLARLPAATRGILHSVLRVAVAQLAVLLPVHAGLLLLLYGDAAEQVQRAAVLSLAVVPGMVTLHFGLAILQGRRRFTAVNVCRLLPSSLWMVAVVSVFVAGRGDLAMLVLLWGVGSLVAGATALGAALRCLPPADPAATVPETKAMLRFGTRAFLGSASPVDMFSVDQAVVGLFVSPTALGLYVVATAFTNLPKFLAQSIGLVAYPSIAALPDRAAMRASLWRFFLVTLALSGACVMALELLVGTLVPLFYGPEFVGAVPLTRVLLVAAVFISCRRLLADGARGCGRPVMGSAAEAASWVSLGILLPVLVPLLGVNGVAIAVVLSSAISFLLLAIGLWMEPAGPGIRRKRSAWGFRPNIASGKSWTGGLAWAVAAGGAGAALPFLSSLAAFLLIVTLAATGLALIARRHFRRTLRSISPQSGDGQDDTDGVSRSDRRFRKARTFYYLGLLFVGQAVLRPPGGLTASDLFFLAAFLATFLELASSRRAAMPRLRPQSLIIGSLLFALGVVISSAPLESPGESLALGLRFLYLTLVWFWVGSVVLRNTRQVAAAVSLWAISIGLSGLAGVAQLFLGDVIPGTSPFYGRMTGTALHMNDLGGMAAIALPAAVALVARPPEARRGRRTAIAIVMLIGSGVLLSGSVGGLLAATVGVAVYTIASPIRRRTVVTVMVVFLGGALLLNAQQEAGTPSPLERASRVTGPSRVETNRTALEAIADGPVIGHGIGQVVPTTGFQVHNVILAPWYEGGLFALLGMVVILTGLARTALQVVRSARSGREWQLAIGLLAAFCSFLTFAMGAPVLFQRYCWVPGALLIALRCQQLRTRRAETPTVPPALKPVAIRGPA